MSDWQNLSVSLTLIDDINKKMIQSGQTTDPI